MQIQDSLIFGGYRLRELGGLLRELIFQVADLEGRLQLEPADATGNSKYGYSGSCNDRPF
ncbi:hypothetical protein GCM10010918_16520 [Paenibacillus radicis (ex Gao et al. 2016)]|uniref:Uncharacterized protein n=1 Tax=Paenibacillus radicis (ex Gao et al. 2016) TaxID=1737354 RepID=A0A917H0W8_9BACL|nr:hypothetical protein GCM10010918_16520 [Paenibacillus radicis (ex Gao et al. 2016)]